jgi:hypothetical protein
LHRAFLRLPAVRIEDSYLLRVLSAVLNRQHSRFRLLLVTRFYG